MAETSSLPSALENSMASFAVGFEGVGSELFDQITPKEVMLGESLLTPGLQTSVTFDSYKHTAIIKNFDALKNANMGITIQKPSLEKYGYPGEMNVFQRTYRLDNRHPINNSNERFTVRACDQTQLEDLKTLVSKSWKCTSPSEVVAHALYNCVGAQKADIEQSWFPRDYIADNIHPFQVISQQANYACAQGYDPSFIHYMTYDEEEGDGIHHFRSLLSLTEQEPIMEFTFNEVGGDFALPNSLLRYSFPCDFDLMSDIMNGIDENGNNINSVILLNPADKTFSFFNNDAFNFFGCGVGSAVIKVAISNQNTAQRQDMCPDYSQYYLQFRQGRMNLLAKDKIAIRMTVPFNPILHAGKVVRVNLPNKEYNNASVGNMNYGYGDYLILHMFHHITNGGLATTTMDCVSTTVGGGIA
jgi:hypothetical protein